MCILAKRLSDNQRIEIVKSFISGKTVDELSEEFNCTKSTISRNLKNNLGEDKYKKLISINKADQKTSFSSLMVGKSRKVSEIEKKIENECITEKKEINFESEQFKDQESFSVIPFEEIAPLIQDIDNSPQKDLSSVPLSDIELPNIVYMIVNKSIELETKLLKEYPEWQFLPQYDLERKTIEIFNNSIDARRFCSKDQKVIKVPNTNVFKIATPILLSRGISRIVNDDKLISLKSD